MKKKWVIILSIFLGVLLIFGYFIFSSFNGSLIYKLVFNNKVEKYIEANYKNNDFTIGRVKYDFKFGEYYCEIQSKSSKDTTFLVKSRFNGELYDTYDSQVNKRTNTYFRLCDELNEITPKVIKKLSFKSDIAICDFAESENTSKLKLDMKLDLSNPPFPCVFTLYAQTKKDEPTFDEYIECIRELNSLLKDYNFEYLSVTLEYPKNEGDENLQGYLESKYSVTNIPTKIIESEKLEKYIKSKVN